MKIKSFGTEIYPKRLRFTIKCLKCQLLKQPVTRYYPITHYYVRETCSCVTSDMLVEISTEVSVEC